MRGRAYVTLLTALLALAIAPAPAAVPRRVLLVLVDEPLALWERTPALRDLLDDAALALVQPVPSDRARAVAVIGAGRDDGDDPMRLARTLSLRGIPFVARAEEGRALGAANIHVEVERAVPGDLATPSLAVLSGSALVAPARRLLQREDVLLVLALPRDERTGLLAAYGRGMTGVLSAHGHAVVTLRDIAPSILSLLAIDVPAAMRGRVFRALAADDPVRVLRGITRGRSPVPAIVVIAITAVAFWVGRRRRRGDDGGGAAQPGSTGA